MKRLPSAVLALLASLSCGGTDHPSPAGTGLSNACAADSDCNDQAACTDDFCVAGIGGERRCEYVPHDDRCGAFHLCLVAGEGGPGCVARGSGLCAGLLDGDACDRDNNPCTPDVCVGGTCEARGNTCVCDDDIPCPNDHNACNGQLECRDHACVVTAGTVVVCNASPNPCMASVCDPMDGVCKDSPLPALTVCEDADPCTIEDICNDTGQCLGTPKVCDDDNACTADSCDGSDGTCLHPLAVPLSSGCCDKSDTCDDGNECTVDACTMDYHCTHEPLATAGQDCCVSDSDCDDMDACTRERCDETFHCVYSGEPPLSNGTLPCSTIDACTVPYCNAVTGSCEELTTKRPSLLLRWDGREGGTAPGLRVIAGRPVRDAVGMRSADTSNLIVRLPAHFEPAGVKVLTIDVVAADGNEVEDTPELRVRDQLPPYRDEQEFSAYQSFGYAWVDPPDQHTDVTLKLLPGTILMRLEYRIWGASGCKPLQEIELGSGTALFQSAVTVQDGGFLAAFHSGSLVSVAGADEQGRALSLASTYSLATQLPGTMDYGSSMIPAGPDRFLLAFGGIQPAVGATGVDEIRLVLLDRQGIPVDEHVMVNATGMQRQTQPRLLRTEDDQIFLVWGRKQAIGEAHHYDVMLRGLGVTGDKIAWATDERQVNLSPIGVAPQPAIVIGPAGRAVFWVVDVEQGLSLHARWIDPNGVPEGSAIGILPKAVSSIMNLTGIFSERTFFLAWRQPATQDLQVLQLENDLDFLNSEILATDIAPQWRGERAEGAPFSPSWLVADQGAALMYERVFSSTTVDETRFWSRGVISGEDMFQGIVMQRIPIKTTTSLQTAPWTPFMAVSVYNDRSSTPYRMVQGFLAPTCTAGLVDCRDPAHPGVCVGFRYNRYVTGSGSLGWCTAAGR